MRYLVVVLCFALSFSEAFAKELWKDYEVLPCSFMKYNLMEKSSGLTLNRLDRVKEVLYSIRAEDGALDSMKSAISETQSIKVALLYAVIAKYTLTPIEREAAMRFLNSEFPRLRVQKNEKNEKHFLRLSEIVSVYLNEDNAEKFPLSPEGSLIRKILKTRNILQFQALGDDVKKLGNDELTAFYYLWRLLQTNSLSKEESEEYERVKIKIDDELLAVFLTLETLKENMQSIPNIHRLYLLGSDFEFINGTARNAASSMNDLGSGAYFAYLTYKSHPHFKDATENLYYVLTFFRAKNVDKEAAFLAGFITEKKKTIPLHAIREEEFSLLKERLAKKMGQVHFDTAFLAGEDFCKKHGVYENTFYERSLK